MFLVGNDQMVERFANADQKENFFKFSYTKLVNVCVNFRPESSINITPKIISDEVVTSRSGSSISNREKVEFLLFSPLSFILLSIILLYKILENAFDYSRSNESDKKC